MWSEVINDKVRYTIGSDLYLKIKKENDMFDISLIYFDIFPILEYQKIRKKDIMNLMPRVRRHLRKRFCLAKTKFYAFYINSCLEDLYHCGDQFHSDVDFKKCRTLFYTDYLGLRLIKNEMARCWL